MAVGSKAFCTIAGDVASVPAGVAAGCAVLADSGVLVNAVVISPNSGSSVPTTPSAIPSPLRNHLSPKIMAAMPGFKRSIELPYCA